LAKGWGGGFDNAKPRDPGFFQEPFRARILAAHQNGWEALPLFAAAIILAEMRHAPQGTINVLAVAFVLLRIVYIGMYAANKPTPRSAVWFSAFAVNLAIFFMPWWAGG
jgi:uncharacterized MAPEG superfamily protein